VADKPTPEQALAILWREVAQEHFLRGPTAAEALAALEQRREMVQRMLGLREVWTSLSDGAALLMLNHFHTLLKAESTWLEHALVSMRVSMNSRGQS
jgi:hypothetical protein